MYIDTLMAFVDVCLVWSSWTLILREELFSIPANVLPLLCAHVRNM